MSSRVVDSLREMRGEGAPAPSSPDARKVRALFLSDLHLGTKGAQAERVLDFLRRHEAETIYLVGDIVDGWRLKRGWYWPQAHNDVVQTLLHKGRKGVRLVYIPGNHDEFLRDYIGMSFGAIEILSNTIHEGVDGKRYLVMHGDEFDFVVGHAKWLAHFGDGAYVFALALNRYINFFRRRLGLQYWSLSAWAKMKVKNAVIGEYEKALTDEAKRRGCEGVICGHIHRSAQKDSHGVAYLNCGDWVESCTAVVEHVDGRFEMVAWAAPGVPEGIATGAPARAAA